TILYLYNGKLGQSLPNNMPESVIQAVSDPLNPGTLRAVLESHLGNTPQASALLHSVQIALMYAIGTVFAIYGTLLVSVVILNLFLKEIPLRKKPANEPNELQVSTE